MKSNPEANFDILFLLYRLSPVYGYVGIREIFNLCYLSLLLSIFDGKPVSDWGYNFTYSENDPFSYSLLNEVKIMSKAGFLENNTLDSYRITENTSIILKNLMTLERFGRRIKYLQACADATLNIPLPLVVDSLNYEPMLQEKKISFNRELLGEGITIHKLYDQFNGIRQVLDKKVEDLWIVSTLWLKYLSHSSHEGANDNEH